VLSSVNSKHLRTMDDRRSTVGVVGAPVGGPTNGEEPSRNVQVAVRCRPLNSREKNAGVMHVVSTDPANKRVSVNHKKTDRSYGPYDKVFGPYATQSDIFEAVVRPIVQEVMQVCVYVHNLVSASYSRSCLSFAFPSCNLPPPGLQLYCLRIWTDRDRENVRREC
jgi:hypothetical protein